MRPGIRLAVLMLAVLGAVAAQAPAAVPPGRIYDPSGSWTGTFVRPNRAGGVADAYFYLDQGGRNLDGGITLYGDNDEVFILPFRGRVVGRNVISGKIETPDGRFGTLRGQIHLGTELLRVGFNFPRDRGRITGSARLRRSR